MFIPKGTRSLYERHIGVSERDVDEASTLTLLLHPSSDEPPYAPDAKMCEEKVVFAFRPKRTNVLSRLSVVEFGSD